MAKKYDIVETSKMSAEYDGSLLIGSCYAETALENGRFIVCDEVAKTARYAVAGEEDIAVLHASVEKLYNGEGLTEYRVEKGEMPRGMRTRKGDIFITTALDGEIAKGDKVAIGTDGKLAVAEDGKIVVLEATKLGWDRIPAIKVLI